MFSSPSGDPICRKCNALEQNVAVDARAQESLQQGAPEGPEPASFGTPIGTIVVGAIVMALGVFWLCAGYFLGGKIFVFPFLLFGSGLFALARGIQSRRR